MTQTSAEKMLTVDVMNESPYSQYIVDVIITIVAYTCNYFGEKDLQNLWVLYTHNVYYV